MKILVSSWLVFLIVLGTVTQSYAEKSILCGTTPIPCQSTPSQGLTLTNSQTTGAATTAVTVTLAALAGARAHVYSVEARCNTAAATSDLLISDGGTTIWSTPPLGVVNAATNFVRVWPVGLTGATNSQVLITLAACTAGTGTLIVQADRY